MSAQSVRAAQYVVCGQRPGGGIVKRFSTFIAASVLAVIAVGMLAGSLFAQASPGVYPACAPDQRESRAADLPDVVDQDRCPVGGREIVDGGISVVVPA